MCPPVPRPSILADASDLHHVVTDYVAAIVLPASSQRSLRETDCGLSAKSPHLIEIKTYTLNSSVSLGTFLQKLFPEDMESETQLREVEEESGTRRDGGIEKGREIECKISEKEVGGDMMLHGKQDYKKTKLDLKLTRLKAEAKKNSSGFKDAFLVIAAIVFFVFCVYAFFYLNLSTELDLDVDLD
ncbi:hypothetical protein NQZ68_001830 [Dissostichus eleginoides]|nr:hypothetical protein NQZ68_001830 [Dissostichus eleginoides]